MLRGRIDGLTGIRGETLGQSCQFGKRRSSDRTDFFHLQFKQLVPGQVHGFRWDKHTTIEFRVERHNPIVAETMPKCASRNEATPGG